MSKTVKEQEQEQTQDETSATSESEEVTPETVIEATAEEATAETETETETTEATAEETSEEDETVADEEVPSANELETQLKEAQAEAQKNMDGWQRSAAELVNYKKRQEEQNKRRREDAISYVISQIFPALDDLDLAFQNIPEGLNEQEQNWVEGFNLVKRKLLKVLENNNVEVINAEGQFDPNLHEAVTHEASEEHESNAIIAELRCGYKMGKRILRPSLVRVAQ